MPTRSIDSSDSRNESSRHRSKSRWTTRQLVTLSLMCALAAVLSFIEFPIFPSASFLKLDVSLVPVVVVAFEYGASSGVLCGTACAVIHGIITGNWVGALMSIIVAVVFIVPCALIYSKLCNIKGAVLGLSVATICLVVGVSAANLVIDTTFYGMPFDAVVGLLVPAIIPFNIIKGIVVSVLSAIVFKSIKGLLDDEFSENEGA